MIRPFQESDLPQLLDVWYRASKLAHPFLDEEFHQNERVAIATVYIPFAETWVCTVDDVVVGFVALIQNEIGGLFVDPDRHGQGLGRSLVDHAVQLRGALEVDVFKENVIGRRFYDRYGFEVVLERPYDRTGDLLLRMRYAAIRNED